MGASQGAALDTVVQTDGPRTVSRAASRDVGADSTVTRSLGKLETRGVSWRPNPSTNRSIARSRNHAAQSNRRTTRGAADWAITGLLRAPSESFSPNVDAKPKKKWKKQMGKKPSSGNPGRNVPVAVLPQRR